MDAFFIRFVRTFIRAIALLVLWVAIGYGVAIGLRLLARGVPGLDVSLGGLPGGRAVIDAAGWVYQMLATAVTTLDPIGFTYSPGGGRTLCMLSTPGCSRGDLGVSDIDLSGFLPHLGEQTWTWIAIGVIAVALASLVRRRHG